MDSNEELRQLYELRVAIGDPTGKLMVTEVLDRATAIVKATRQWLVAHDENMHLLTQGVLPPTEVKTAVHNAINGIRATLAAKGQG